MPIPDYRSRYADNISEELPRIPAGKTYADFRAFSQADRDLAHWHLNYETVACHPGVAVEEVLAPAATHAATVADRRYRVTKMKFGKTKDASGKNVNDKTIVIYNDFITLKNIPHGSHNKSKIENRTCHPNFKSQLHSRLHREIDPGNDL